MSHPTTPSRGAAEDPPAAVHTAATQPAVVRPVLRVVRGDATPEELAALVAVLAARAARAAAPPPPGAAPVSPWARPQPRRPLPSPGPGAWQAAARDARTRAAW